MKQKITIMLSKGKANQIRNMLNNTRFQTLLKIGYNVQELSSGLVNVTLTYENA